MTAPEPGKRWWHLYAGEARIGDDADQPMLVQIMAGDVPIGPDDVTLTGGRVQDDQVWPPRNPGDDPVPLHYVGSWDHEPSDAERDAVLPEEYREEPADADAG